MAPPKLFHVSEDAGIARFDPRPPPSPDAGVVGDAVAAHLIDQLVQITGPEAMKWSQALAQKEGVFVGITAGATFAGALKIAEQAKKGATILAMLPDTGERYLSTPLFGDVPADMTDEERAIGASSPLYADDFAPKASEPA